MRGMNWEKVFTMYGNKKWLNQINKTILVLKHIYTWFQIVYILKVLEELLLNLATSVFLKVDQK